MKAMTCVLCLFIPLSLVVLESCRTHAGLPGIESHLAGDGCWILDNGFVKISLSEDKRAFTVSAKDIPFIQEGRLRGELQKVAWAALRFPLGTAKAIELTYTDLEKDRLILIEGVPFAILQAVFHNGTDRELVINRTSPFTLVLGETLPIPTMKALGVDGLTSSGLDRTSYTYLAFADPDSRAGVVSGWLSQDRASGIVLSAAEKELIRVTARSEYGRLRIEPGQSADGELFAIGYFEDALDGLEAYANSIADYYDVKLKPAPSGYCTWYSHPHGGAADAESMAELAAFNRKELVDYGFDLMQIDDKWQGQPRHTTDRPVHDYKDLYLGKPDKKDMLNPGASRWWWGPASDFTRHDPVGPYPGGMKNTADRIRAAGITPGLWLMPFAWDPLSKPLAPHHDYFVKREDGSLYYVDWAGWSLDMTHQGARAFLSDTVSRMTRDWGFGYLKMDGLWAGLAVKILYPTPDYRDDHIGDAVFHDPDKTNVEAFRDGLKLIRESAGDKVFLLGCTVAQNYRTLGASFGLLDAMRVGRDVQASWSHILPCVEMGTRTYFLNRRIWTNDPDCLMLRDSVSLEQARAWGSWIALSGQLNIVSEWLPDLAMEKLDIVKRTMPSTGVCGRPIDLFESSLPRIWQLSHGEGFERRDIIGLFNWDDKNPASLTLTLNRLDLPDSETGLYAGFDFWSDRFIPPFSDTIPFNLEPSSCLVISIKPLKHYPQVISTSRHVSQGIVSLENETWDDAKKTLKGTSAVIAGDAHELRILLPEGNTCSKPRSLMISDGDIEAGVSAVFKQDGQVVRVRIITPQNRNVNWKLMF